MTTATTIEGEVVGGAECTALALPNEIVNLPPKRLTITHAKSDAVKAGQEAGHFQAEGVSVDVFYPTELNVAVLQFKGPMHVVKDITKLSPRSYFPGKFVDGSKPVCKSEDGITPVAAHAGEPQLQPMATTCQECAFSKWNNETKTPPPCREKIRLQLAHVESGLRFTLDINAGTKAAYRAIDMYNTTASTVTFQNAITKSSAPNFSYSTAMSLTMGQDGWPVLSFSKIKPLEDWQRFIPLYEDLIKPKEKPVAEPVVEQAVESILDEGI